MKIKKHTDQLSLRLPEDYAEYLRIESIAKGISVSDLVRILIQSSMVTIVTEPQSSYVKRYDQMIRRASGSLT